MDNRYGHEFMEALEWMHFLDPKDRLEMLRDLREAKHEAIKQNDPFIFTAMFKGWRSTAEALAHPELMAQLLRPIDQANTIPLERP